MKAKKEKTTQAARIISLLRCAQMSLKHRIMERAKDFGLTVPQFMVIHEISKGDGATMHDVVAALALPKSTVSRIVDQLVNMSIVKSKRPFDDRRTVNLSITHKMRKSKMKVMESVGADIERKLGRKKGAGIIAALEEIVEIIKY
jgi:DNA-binding MarR family transcriptional regulator